jgi:hypothetical protein
LSDRETILTNRRNPFIDLNFIDIEVDIAMFHDRFKATSPIKISLPVTAFRCARSATLGMIMPVLPEARTEELTPIGSGVNGWRPGAYSFIMPSHLDPRRDPRRLCAQPRVPEVAPNRRCATIDASLRTRLFCPLLKQLSRSHQCLRWRAPVNRLPAVDGHHRRPVDRGSATVENRAIE